MFAFWKKHKRWLLFVFEIVFFVSIFILSIKPNDNSDTFYHVKAGQIFVQQGILHEDIFSHTAQGREWYPYEWFFEIIIYLYQHTFGYNALVYLVAGIATLQIGFLFVFIKKLFNSSTVLSLALCFIYFAWSYEQFVARPQLFVIPIFTFALFTIFYYIKDNRNIFLWVIPFTWILGNMHGSVVYIIYLFFSYSLLSFLLYFFTKKSEWLQKAKVLGIYTAVTLIVSILPPIGLLQYRLLLLFSHNISLIQSLIAEWVPISGYSIFDQLYYLSGFLGLLLFLIICIKKKNYLPLFLIVPLLPFLLIPFIAFRNTVTAYVVFILCWAWGISLIHWSKQNRLKKVVFLGIFAALLVLYTHVLFISKFYAPKAHILAGEANFLLAHHIRGNMFNGFSQGSYLIYRLYPIYKVFLDLRVDVYVCCELPRDKQMIDHLSSPPSVLDTFMTQNFFNPYHISFAVLPNTGGLQELQTVLTNDPNWELVYFDDNGSIFVRKDGKNKDIINRFGITTATPFGISPVESNNFTQAIKDYQQIIDISDSARSRNALGYIYIKEKSYSQAQKEFEKAISLDPTFDSPYGNLAELALRDGNSAKGIALYEKAQAVNPLRAYTYLRLAQLYVTYQHDTQKAQAILEEGLQNAQNDQDRQTLQNAILQIQNQ